MSLSRQDILDYATRYINQEEIVDFPHKGDLFAFLMRPAEPGTSGTEAQWSFGGYGICTDYTLDVEAKPEGKWVFMHFAALTTFPPSLQTLKLQPPHIASGRFSSADRSQEIRIVKINLNTPIAGAPENSATLTKKRPASKRPKPPEEAKILQFKPRDKEE